MIYRRGVTLDQVTKEMVKFLLIEHKGNKTKVWMEMGVTKRTGYNYLHKFNIPYDYFEKHLMREKDKKFEWVPSEITDSLPAGITSIGRSI